MSDFLESAEEGGISSGEEGSGSEEEGFEEIQSEKPKKERHISLDEDDDDDDEEEEGEDLDKDLEDLIDDNPEVVDEDVSDDEDDAQGKRKHEDSELEDDLDDEDLDLIEENLGIKVNRKHKRRRIRVLSDEEESENEADQEQDERDVIAREIFEGDDDDEMPSQEVEPEKPEEPLEPEDLPDSEVESDVDDFIVNEAGEPISKGKKKKHIIHDDAALQEAQDIFGVDFDFKEFDQYGDEYDEEEELEEEYEEELADEEGEDGEVRPRPRKPKRRDKQKRTIYEVYEPSELERGHFTDRDQEIRVSDMPERFQLRGIPVCPTEEGELDEEAAWIYKYAFTTPPVSSQEYFDQGDGQNYASRFAQKGPSTIGKIREALKFMRNQQYEVPFIAFYRKEYVEPELNISDLWKIYQWDEKWMQLRNRKTNLVRLFEKMQQYQFDQIDPDQPLDSHVRALTEDDIERAKKVQTMEELRDVYQHFLLYYGHDVPKMKAHLKAKRKQHVETGEDGEPIERDEDQDEEDEQETLKQASKKTGYHMYVQAGLAEFARKFGLTPEQYGENLRDNYQRHDVEQDPAEPKELAEEFIKGQLQTTDDVLRGARHMVAMQIAHEPMVRKCVRQVFYERGKISCQPTKRGLKEIDENHPCCQYKYLKNKPIKDIYEDQFLKLSQAKDDSLLTYEIHMDDKDVKHLQTYFQEIESLYHRDEFSNLVEEWNRERSVAVERALNLILYPQIMKEIQGKLMEEAKESIVKACTTKLYNWLKVAPYQTDQQLDEDDDDYDLPKGLRVMGVAFSLDRDTAGYACVLDGEGDVTDFMKLIELTTRRTSWNIEDRKKKESEMEKLKDFIAVRKPHVIAIAAESREAMRVMEDIKELVTELEQEQQMPPINVELMDNELSVIYSKSSKSQHDFREYPMHLRQAVSIARRLRDPLVEFSQLCNADEDILCLRYHTLQEAVSKDELLNALYLEFVNRVNEVGVDVNRCVSHPHTSPLVQFICGLGPRKGYHLLKILKQNNSRLENRTKLVTMCHMGPKVFINCAGFIKIDTTALGDSTEAYVEVLDGSRVHPETYEWARKMAVDALEYDDTAEDANPAGALEEILESPERLRDLDLDAFAEELERQGYGDRHITLYDIRAELNHRYKDLRTPFRSPTVEEKFNILTKETPQTFYIGRLVMCVVSGIAHKKPRGEQLDHANPVRNDETGLWQCPFCKKTDFPELSEVWNHFDAGMCPGQAMGVQTRLDNGVLGFIHLRNLSDNKVTNPEERVKRGMTLHCRIIKIDIERFQVDLTSKSSDLADKENKWKLPKDRYFDFELEDNQKKKEEDKQKHQKRQTYVKRVIAHPSFHNIDYKSCEKLMRNMEQGEVVIRPSSKGSNHLTATWKVADGVLHHIDVREEGKENAFSLGSSLWINTEEFEDLDEIIARYIQPMAAFARDLLNYKYYKEMDNSKREIIEKYLYDDKKKAPSKIPYVFTCSKQFPGKFMLSYLPRKTIRHEFVSVIPDGLKYRGQKFTTLGHLIRWFKEHFRDPIPGTPITTMRTPMGMTGNISGTPGVGAQKVDAAGLQRANARVPGSMFNAMAQITGGTPGQFQTPWQQMATPIMTPMMTPAQQPMMTPAQQSMQTPMHLRTPAQPALTTPAQNPLATPQYVPTPRSQWPGATPGRTPRQQPQQQQQQQPPPQQAGLLPPSHSSQDWAKMAQIWAKRKQMEQKKGSTPRPDQSPMSPTGDATPLIDER